MSLCNVTYKLVEKIIARRLKKILSKFIFQDQFGFLEGRNIHEAIRVVQEGLHTQNITNNKGVILKIDLSKAFNKVRCLYLRFLLNHLGFD